MTAAKNIAASTAASERQIRRRRKKLALKTLENAVLLAVAAIILFPILWMVMTAFKSPKFVYAYTIWFPPTFENFREVFNPRWLIGDKIINSAIISCSTVIIAIPIAVCAAYAFSRLQLPLEARHLPVDSADPIHSGGDDRAAVLRDVPAARPARHLCRADRRRPRHRASLRDLDDQGLHRRDTASRPRKPPSSMAQAG